MQNSGVFSGLSDGTKKTIVGAAPPQPAKPAPVKSSGGGHRRGGYCKHGGGK